jgi:outer membrane protein assembly factor BamD (BamD/ComL family)
MEGVERLASVESIQDDSTRDQKAARVLAGNISGVISNYSNTDFARVSKDVKEQSEVERACS